MFDRKTKGVYLKESDIEYYIDGVETIMKWLEEAKATKDQHAKDCQISNCIGGLRAIRSSLREKW